MPSPKITISIDTTKHAVPIIDINKTFLNFDRLINSSYNILRIKQIQSKSSQRTTINFEMSSKMPNLYLFAIAVTDLLAPFEGVFESGAISTLR